MKRYTIGLAVISALLAGCPLTPDLDRVTQNRSPLVTASPVPSQSATPAPEASPKRKVTKVYIISSLPKYYELRYNLEEVVAAWQKTKWTSIGIRKTCPVAKGLYAYDEVCVFIKEVKLSAKFAGQTYWRDGYIDIHINLNARMYIQHEQQATLCHEIGHVLGAPHIKSRQSCMIDVDTGAKLPSKTDIAFVDSLGEWNFEKMYDSAVRTIDSSQLPN